MNYEKPGQWLSCDWGTSNLRIRLVEIPSLYIREEVIIDKGIMDTYAEWKRSGKGETARTEFYNMVLEEQIELLEKKIASDLDDVPLIISGMVSSTIGMMNLPYKTLPFATDGSDMETLLLPVDVLNIRKTLIISGASSGSDIMRGEETILFGCVDSENIDDEQLYIFPGTHSKHVFVKDAKAISFATYMTGEFFWLLSEMSVLGKGIKKAGVYTEPKNQEAFKKGVQESWKKNLLNSCFKVRTNIVLQKSSAEENYFFLSGLLIGSELQNAISFQQGITISGDQMFNEAYEKALQLLDYRGSIKLVDSNNALVRGQWKVGEELMKN